MEAANGSGPRSYLVEVYQPRSGAGAAGIQARYAAEAVSRTGTPVRYVRSIFVPEDETCFHLFVSSSREAVAAVAERAGFVLARVSEAFERPLNAAGESRGTNPIEEATS